MSLLEVRGLRKQYGSRTVVNGVDIDVNAGEIVGLLGPNGAGKTTSFRMVVGMITPKAGRVTFNGKEITHFPMYQRARLGLGYLAQDSSVFRRLTVEQNLFAILELMTTRRGEPYRATKAQQRARVDELLEQFGLTRSEKASPGTSREENGDGSKSPGVWFPNRCSSCLMNPLPASIPKPSATFKASSRTSSTPASACSSPTITWPRPFASPIEAT